MSNSPILLFGKDVPVCVFIDQIYDPDVDGPDVATTVANGKYVLTPPSPCFDRVTNVGGLYYVHAVDPVTYKHDIRPAKILYSVAETGTAIVSYGNDRFMLYYDDRLKPTALYVDGKLFVAGLEHNEYRLYRLLEDGSREYISLYLDADEQYRGQRIPMSRIGTSEFKRPTNCHTLSAIADGDIIHIEVVNTNGVVTAEASLMAVRSNVLNDLANEANPIVGFDMTCTQMRGEDFFVFAKQDPQHLNIVPYVTYADGTTRNIPVDSAICYLYGLTDYSASFPGYKQPIMAKLFLVPRELSTIGTVTKKYKFLTCVKNLITIPNENSCYAKLSVIPLWNNTLQKYELRWFAYLDTRNASIDVTDLVAISDDTPFNGQSFIGATQKITVSLDLAQLINGDNPIPHVQTVYITLKPYTVYDRYLFKDGVNDPYVYGVESNTYRRPIIHYDATLSQYFIPSTIFGNKEAVLLNFYTNARPLYNPDKETIAPTPTHFTVRDVHGRMVISTPIEIEQYTQAWSIIAQGDASQFVGGTLIVEWLVANATGYDIIYGAPVEVVRSETGYNTETNNLYQP